MTLGINSIYHLFWEWEKIYPWIKTKKQSVICFIFITTYGTKALLNWVLRDYPTVFVVLQPRWSEFLYVHLDQCTVFWVEFFYRQDIFIMHYLIYLDSA